MPLSLCVGIDQRIERRLPPTPTAAMVAPLVQRHYELTQTTTRLQNQLTAICDQLFPEFTEVFLDPNALIALQHRERWPTPELVAATSLEELRQFRRAHHQRRPGDKQLLRLQELARESIGVKDRARVHGLVAEQAQLIKEYRLLTEHLESIDNEMDSLVAADRQGQILLSIPGVGPFYAAAILSGIGNIRNFERASKLRRFAGWSPQANQTGISYDRNPLTKTGTRLLKPTMYLLTWSAIKYEPWKSLYTRLVLKKCVYDQRKGRMVGKRKVLGRIAGQILGMIFKFLKTDADLVDATPAGQAPPPPELYDPTVHFAHRHGGRPHAHHDDESTA